jgi:hypothetical protein
MRGLIGAAFAVAIGFASLLPSGAELISSTIS